jgi:hypothetical protein
MRRVLCLGAGRATASRRPACDDTDGQRGRGECGLVYRRFACMSARLMVSFGVQHVTYNGVLLVFKLLRSARALLQSDSWSYLMILPDFTTHVILRQNQLCHNTHSRVLYSTETRSPQNPPRTAAITAANPAIPHPCLALRTQIDGAIDCFEAEPVRLRLCTCVVSRYSVPAP